MSGEWGYDTVPNWGLGRVRDLLGYYNNRQSVNTKSVINYFTRSDIYIGSLCPLKVVLLVKKDKTMS